MTRLALASFLLAAPLAHQAAAQDVIFRDGFELVCPPELGDCNGDGVDCETSLRTLTDCGDCDVPCSRPNADADCATGVCEIGSCFAGFGDCDLADPNGCEQPLNTLSHCGTCGVPCNRANATATCGTGTCQIASCNGGFGNCDFNTSNGCEQTLNTLSHCGACGQPCNRANATATCGTGTCQLASCNSGFGSCDFNTSNGCEQPLNTLSHCGNCNVPCNLANANESCSTGSCQLTSCANGFSNCDGNQANGCELPHGGYSNASPGENLGSHAADSKDGFGCPSQSCTHLLSRTGTRGRFFQITAIEDSNCDAYLSFHFELVSPPGVNYNLHVHGTTSECDPQTCSSTLSTSADHVVAYRNDDWGGEDGFTVTVEVVHFSGASCQPWTLNVYRRGC